MRQGTPLPPPLTILPGHLNQLIYLAVPIRTPNSEETSFDNNPESLARFRYMKVKSVMPIRWGEARNYCNLATCACDCYLKRR